MHRMSKRHDRMSGRAVRRNEESVNRRMGVELDGQMSTIVPAGSLTRRIEMARRVTRSLFLVPNHQSL